MSATEPPALPTMADAQRAGIDGERLYLGDLEGVSCIALHAERRLPPSRPAGSGADCAHCSCRSRRLISRSRDAPSRSSNGTATTAIAGAAPRLCA